METPTVKSRPIHPFAQLLALLAKALQMPPGPERNEIGRQIREIPAPEGLR